MRLRNLLLHLPAHGWSVDVISGPTGLDRDDTLSDGLSLGRVLQVDPIVHAPRLQRADWAGAAMRAARKLARDADAVLISGGPFAPFALGRGLRGRYILDFRDPWSWEPRFGRLERRIRRTPGRALERLAETAAVRAAAAVTTVAPEITDAYRALYPAVSARIETLRHGWEPGDFSGAVTPLAGPELSYVGSFVEGERTPEFLLETARVVRARGVPLRVRLVGQLPDSMRPKLTSAVSEGWLEVVGRVTHRDAIEAMRRATVLWAQPGDLRFLITGKIYEYLAADSPVVAVAPPDGALARFLGESGGGIVVEQDAVRCADAVLAALNGDAPPLRREVLDDVSAPRLAKRLADILNRVVGPA